MQMPDGALAPVGTNPAVSSAARTTEPVHNATLLLCEEIVVEDFADGKGSNNNWLVRGRISRRNIKQTKQE